MDEEFKIYVDQLKDGRSEDIAEKLDPKMMDISENDLKFQDPIHIEGQAYMADNDLVVHFDIQTVATMPCVICNEEVKVPVVLDSLYHTVPEAELKSGIYNFKEMLRENILLTTPLFTECHDGICPEREKLKKFFSDEDKQSREERYHPFADLDKFNTID